MSSMSDPPERIVVPRGSSWLPWLSGSPMHYAGAWSLDIRMGKGTEGIRQISSGGAPGEACRYKKWNARRGTKQGPVGSTRAVPWRGSGAG